MSSMSTDASFTSISYLSCKIVFFGSILSLFFCWSIFSVSEWGNHSGPPTFSWALRAKKSNFWNGHHRGAISFIRGSMWSPEIPTPLEHFFGSKSIAQKSRDFGHCQSWDPFEGVLNLDFTHMHVKSNWPICFRWLQTSQKHSKTTSQMAKHSNSTIFIYLQILNVSNSWYLKGFLVSSNAHGES